MKIVDTAKRLMCEAVYGGHVFRIHDNLGVKQCLNCTEMKDYYDKDSY